MEELRTTETHSSGDESAGTVWGFRYELIWVALGGGAVSFLIATGLYAKDCVTWFSTVLAAIPAMISVGFALFRQTHPPGYDSDLIDLWIQGPGFGPTPPDDYLHHDLS